MNPKTLTWIEKQKPMLVGWAETYVEDSELYFPKNSGSANSPKNSGSPSSPKKSGKGMARVSGSQLRNLLSAAQSGSPLAVLLNFLRYQMGRRQGWAHTPSGQELETLLKEKLSPLCEEFPETHEADPYELQSHLAAQLLGFIIREYTYRCKLEGTRP
jgi:hypothetical protein